MLGALFNLIQCWFVCCSIKFPSVSPGSGLICFLHNCADLCHFDCDNSTSDCNIKAGVLQSATLNASQTCVGICFIWLHAGNSFGFDGNSP